MSYKAIIAFVHLFCALSKVASAGSTFSFAQCAIDAAAEYLSAPNSTFLIRADGEYTDDLSQAWGISYEACNNLCGPNGGWEPFDWPFFSAGISSWVLPWLALTAQLPYETRSGTTNLLSLLLAVGSPMLITTSLCVTILNSRWISKYFGKLRDQNQSLGGKQAEAIDAARVFLRESQHVPIKIGECKAQFAQLVVLPENHAWWESLRKEVMKSKRGWSYSLLAQTAWVAVIEVIAIIDFFSPTVDSVMGIGVAVNNLWIWMIPVTLGWVWVGTQDSAVAIREALLSAEASIGFPLKKVTGRMTGFQDYSYQKPATPKQSDLEANLDGPLTLESSRFELFNETSRDAIQWTDLGGSRPKTKQISDAASIQESGTVSKRFLGCSVAGFAVEPGPIFNYARVWNHISVARCVGSAFHALNINIEAKRPLQDRFWVEDACKWKENLQSYPNNVMDANNIGSSTSGISGEFPMTITPAEMERYIILNPATNPPNLPSIMNNYLISVAEQSLFSGELLGHRYSLRTSPTPLVGLGCESGSYMFFAITATVAWFFLVTSAYLSHVYSMHTVVYESSLAATSTVRQAEDTSAQSKQFQSPVKVTKAPSEIIALAIVLTRICGIFLASGNAVWLLLLSIMQFTKLYTNCWCWADVLQYGAAKGWVPIWTTAEQFYDASVQFWIAGMVMSASVLIFTGAFFIVMPGENLAKRLKL